MEPRGAELIQRYKQNYGIPEAAEISEEMILRHWAIEKGFRIDLLATTPENRWEVFERCYTRLYRELEWLNRYSGLETLGDDPRRQTVWSKLIGAAPKKVYEVGSGDGSLISYLAGLGHECRATEITRERGQILSRGSDNVTWAVSDGIHLERFEEPNTYDVVISSHVIEHIHPDDLVEHFGGARKILRPAGHYVFATPHRLIGPSDVSWVFKSERPMGMHLREYTYRELLRAMHQAGFASVAAPVIAPRRVSRLAGKPVQVRVSASYVAYLLLAEALLERVPQRALQRRLALVARRALFATNIILIGRTPAA